MVFGVRHGFFIKGIPKEIEISEGAIPWICDNGGAIQSALKIGLRVTKQIDVKLKCTKKYVQEETINLELVYSRNQSVDIPTDKRAHKSLLETLVDSGLSADRCAS